MIKPKVGRITPTQLLNLKNGEFSVMKILESGMVVFTTQLKIIPHSLLSLKNGEFSVMKILESGMVVFTTRLKIIPHSLSYYKI